MSYLGKPVWATNTNGKDATRLQLFPDGYMALTKSNGETVWLLNNAVPDIDGCYLEMKGDNLVLYGRIQGHRRDIYKQIWSRPQ
jgi:hypothetical protein